MVIKIMNIEMAEKIISTLVEQHQVQTFCICPGGRNSPLVSVLAGAKGLQVFSFFEERSAGFFALGQCKQNKKPCAVLTTSGTAVAELLPAVIEAYYSHLPLIVVSADRPTSYRGSGAPQAIQQPGIFSHYVNHSWDLEKTLNFDFSDWDQITPSHINVCFDEPLIDKEIKNLLDFSDYFNSSKKQLFSVPSATNPTSLSNQEQIIKDFFSKTKKPLVILSELQESTKEAIKKILIEKNQPVYAEASSGLRESKILSHLIIKSGSNYLQELASNKKIDGVISIGRRPCTRFFRDLENTYSHLPVLSVSDQQYSGLSRISSAVGFKSFLNIFSKTKTNNELTIIEKDRKYFSHLNKLLLQYPLSEVSLIHELSKIISKNSMVFLGNSLPIREWNLIADYQDKKIKYQANRGANGIDGLISTFLGACEKDRDNWCVLGDLSCLYDLQGPWILKQMDPHIRCFLVVINNQGGQIFSPFFKENIFLNEHKLNFKSWAEFWSLNYYCISEWTRKITLSSPAVIELKPDLLQSKQFNQAYKTIWENNS